MTDQGQTTPGGCFVGVDVGGSALKVGAMSDSGEVITEDSVSVAVGARSAALLDLLGVGIRAMCGDRVIRGVGLGLPGALDRDRGVITMSPNLPWLAGVPMRDELAMRLGIDPTDVHLENDANAAALGEQRFGGGAGLADMMFVTLGTGIGSGLVLGGRLHLGGGLACEGGHVVVDTNGLVCGCGNRGCVETLASATAARRRAKEANLPQGDAGNLELLTEIARAGAGPERDLLHAVGRDLGRGLAAVVVLVDVRTFVFGGGFSQALDVMSPAIVEGIEERLFPARPITLLRAELGNRAGWMGAAWIGRSAACSSSGPGR